MLIYHSHGTGSIRSTVWRELENMTAVFLQIPFLEAFTKRQMLSISSYHIRCCDARSMKKYSVIVSEKAQIINGYSPPSLKNGQQKKRHLCDKDDALCVLYWVVAKEKLIST